MSMTKDMMNHDLTADQVASREMLRLMVRSAIFCPVSGALLANKTAVLLEGEGQPPIIMAPEVWARQGAEVLAACESYGITPVVTEGAA